MNGWELAAQAIREGVKIRRKEYVELRGFKYSPQTGNVYRNPSVDRRRPPGVVRYTRADGYRSFQFYGNEILAHRAAFYIKRVLIPQDKEIDHINGSKIDNRWSNLRLVSTRENQQNKSVHRSGKKPGYYVSITGQFLAQINFNGKTKYLGSFPNEEEASSIYKRAHDFIVNGVYDKEIDSILHRKKEMVGVARCGEKYRAHIRINGKQTHLGVFQTIAEAKEAYVKAKIQRADWTEIEVEE